MLPLPTSNSIELQHGCNTVSAFGLDPKGSRLVTGGYDCNVKFWDFEGMDPSRQSFRSLRPLGSSIIKNIDFCPSGNSVLIVGRKAHAKILNRNGLEQFECPEGDRYIPDMAKAKGHCANLNDGCWHPHNNEEFLTCSDDGSLRVWLIDGKSVQKHVIKPSQMRGVKRVPVSCKYNRNGQLVTFTCSDGSIQMWDHRKNFLNTTLMACDAHHGISSVAFSYSNTYLASNGEDDILKLWDLRKFKDPIHSANVTSNIYPMSNCCFSPDDACILTGLSLQNNEEVSKIVFFDRNSFNKVNELKVSTFRIPRIMWHPKLNQIIGSTTRGAMKIFYDPDHSYRGAKLLVTEPKKNSKEIEMIWEHQITSPRALPVLRINPPMSSKIKI